MRRINDWFGLRDCPQQQEMVFAEQGELFPVVRAAGCIRHEIGTCLGPCAGRCSRTSYPAAVRSAEEFLAGTDLAPLAAIEREMAAASAAMAFERAAALRDKLDLFRWLREQMDHLRQASEQPPFVYPVHGADGRHYWYVVAQGRVTAVLPAPRDEAERACRRRAAPGRCLATDEVDGVLLVASRFRRHPEERGRILPVPAGEQKA